MTRHSILNFVRKPVFIALLVFAFLMVLTQYLAYERYLLVKDTELNELNNEANGKKERLQTALSYSQSTAQTLGFIVERYGIPIDFDTVAKELLSANKFIDAVQLVQGGVITHVYPLKGNEVVIGYNILKDSLRNKGAFTTIETKQFFWAGPINLKQGGVGIVGRQPLFKNDKFYGFSAVIIKLPTLLHTIGIDSHFNNGFTYQLSRINTDNHTEEFFLPNHQSYNHALVVPVEIPNGEWRLYVTRKSKSTAKTIREQNEELESRVKERTEELEFFIYSVSHDLRAPLRTINGFSKILRDEYMMKCDNDGKSLISTIASSAQQMDHLVENMLRLARLGKSELRKSPTDMKALVTEVISDMKTLHQHHAMEIVMNDLPAADCDSGLMKQVWTNLISNAVKYSAKHPSPKVEIGYGKKNGSDVYYVKDNGVGFDMQYAHKLFGAFQRLHHADEFEGTGVGLVIVSRVIKKHGGRVFAESESGKGASFYFALPEKN